MYRKYIGKFFIEGDFRILVKNGMFQKRFYGSFQGASLMITCIVKLIK